MTNTTTSKQALVNLIKSNRAFAGKKVSIKDYDDVSLVREWHELLDNLLKVAYKTQSGYYNSESDSIDYSAVFTEMRAIYKWLEVDVKCQSTTGAVICGKSLAFKNKDSAELEYAKSQLSNRKRELTKAEAMADTCKNKQTIIENKKSEIEKLEKQVADLKKIEWNCVKRSTMKSAGAFYKEIEDFIADKIEERQCMTLADVEKELAERKARRKANKQAKRRAEAKAKKAEDAKKADNVENNAENK